MAILLVAEHDNETVSDQTAKALSAALKIGSEVDILVAGKGAKGAADGAAKLEGASKVLLAEADELAERLAEPLAALVVSLADKYTGEQWGAEGEPAAYRIKPYQSADLKVVYTMGRYRLEGAVYNLFDSQQATSIKQGKTTDYDQYYFQPERNFQISVKANF